MDGVERDGVDGVDVALVARAWRCDAVAFEAEVLRGVLLLDVLDGAAALDAADCEARRVLETLHGARLPFEWTLYLFVEDSRIIEADDVHEAVRGADDEELVAGVHSVDAVLALDRRDGLRGAEIPVFDLFVPGTGYEDGGVVDVAGLDAADRFVVHGYLLRGGAGLV